MGDKKSSRSVRTSVLIFISACFILFAMLLFSVFYLTMPKMLLRSEEAYLTQQLDTLTGLMDVSHRNTYVMADDIGIWDETTYFVRGENPDYIKNNWPDTSLLAAYHFNFIVIKDRAGNDLHVEFLDYLKKQPLQVPDGFTDRLSRLSRKVLDMYEKPLPENPEIETLGQGGLLFYQGVPYFLACMPVMESRKAGAPVGTVTLGHILSADYFRDVTHIRTADFDFLTPADGTYATTSTITRESSSRVSTLLPLTDMDGHPVLLRMSDSRPIYRDGRAMLYQAALVLLAVMAGFGLAFYILLNKYLIRPIEILSRDIEKNAFPLEVRPDTYARSTEFITLCTAIRQLDQSRISRENMERILNGLDSIIYVTDPKTDNVLFMNDLMRKQRGIADAGHICWWTLQHTVNGRCEACPKNQLEKEPDGVVVWESQNPMTGQYYHNTDRMIPWVGGKKVHLRHAIDITARKKTEAELLRMSAVVTSSPHCIYFFDLSGNVEYYNASALKTFGFSDKDLAGKNISDVLDPTTLARLQKVIIPRILADGQAEFEIPMTGKDGVTHIMAFCGFTTRNTPVGLGAIASDITEKRQLEKDLITAKELAEHSSRAKGEFLSRMSHEMRTPLNAIIGMSSIAKASGTLSKKTYCLERIEDASHHLLGLINDVLDMSKIEANKFELSFNEFVFEKMLVRVVNVVNYRIDEKDQHFVVHIDNTMPYAIVSDERRLSQVITNLLANAIKFTPEKGTITLSARKLSEADGICTFRVEVSDTGIGISPDQQKNLFNPFEQASGGISRKFGGTGLGLSISRSIIELMGGKIGVISETGKGATFGFTLRAQVGAMVPQVLNPDINWKSFRILVVEDLVEEREYFLDLARSMGFTCRTARDGAEALGIMEENQGAPFNMVFVDWKIPGMNGIELVNAIKSRHGAGVVVILISAMEWDAVEKEATAAGVDQFIPKPLFPSVIRDTISACLGAPARPPEAAEASLFDGCFAGYRILLAEDIDLNREIILSLLQNTGIAIDCAKNGKEAVEKVTADPDAYDMVFMDIHMPEVDGYEAARRIRAGAHPRMKAIPIVAMTANVFREDIEKSLAAGMTDHIGKPVDLAEMVEKLKCYLPPQPNANGEKNDRKTRTHHH